MTATIEGLNMRTLILGAGGIGGYYGGRLAQAGADVTFLVRPARAERLKADGLRIESPCGDVTIPVRAVREPEGAYDLVILSCKAYDLDTALEAIRPAVGACTTILPLLNGIAHLDRLDAALGSDHVIGGTAHISVTLAANGTIRQLNKLHLLTYGARDPAASKGPCDAIEALFATAGFDQKRSDAIMQEMWEKFAFITAASGITCLMRASIGAIMAADDGERQIRTMLTECETVAAAAGHRLRPQALEWGTHFLTARGSDFTASMLRDLEAGAKVEAQHLQGDMIKRGEALGIETGLLRAAYAHLQAYQARHGLA